MSNVSKLDPDFKEKWVAALESGDYKQTTHMLHDGTAYCCLGVACAVLGATFVEKDTDYRPILDGCDIGYDQELGWEGLEATGLTEDEQEVLFKMNDRGKSFAEIAEFIRKEL